MGEQAQQTAAACPLSEREVEALRLLAEGKAYKEIARSMGLSVSTISNLLHRVYRKLDVVGRAQAVLLAAQEGWIAPEQEGRFSVRIALPAADTVAEHASEGETETLAHSAKVNRGIPIEKTRKRAEGRRSGNLARLREIRGIHERLRQLTDERDQLILQALAEGHSQRKVALAIGLAPGRVAGIKKAFGKSRFEREVRRLETQRIVPTLTDEEVRARAESILKDRRHA